MTTLDLTIETIATRYGMTTEAAEVAAREYLAQIEALDGAKYDEENLPAETAEFIIESVKRGTENTPPSLLDEVTAAVERVAAAETELQTATQMRDATIRKAAASGAPKVDIARASGLARAYIYRIIGA